MESIGSVSGCGHIAPSPVPCDILLNSTEFVLESSLFSLGCCWYWTLGRLKLSFGKRGFDVARLG